MALHDYINSFISIFFPESCLGCQRTLLQQEQFICTHCEYALPYTQFHLDGENNAAKSLSGRVPVEAISSYFYFASESIVQQIMHAIKYRNRAKAAQHFGHKYGEELTRLSLYQEATVIIPVPLHSKKRRKRGYNQSEYFGKGLSESMGIEMQAAILIKPRQAESQTQKGRYERYENANETFQIQQGKQLIGQHVLLVDDVFTTGATIEACANALLTIKEVKISVLTLAYTK